VITDIAAFLRYFDGVNRRAVRDFGSLGPAAETWKPPEQEGEDGWSVSQIVSHIATTRVFFARAYAEGAYVGENFEAPTNTREEWVAALEKSAARFHEILEATPDSHLQRRMTMLADPSRTMGAWRVLMQQVEHEIHHRSQVQTYAGLYGWGVSQIFGQRAEDVGLRVAENMRAVQEQ
jgi:uncharacterized damage-inducible protein DinB